MKKSLVNLLLLISFTVPVISCIANNDANGLGIFEH